MKCLKCGEPLLTETRVVFSSSPKRLECMNCHTRLRRSPRGRLWLIVGVLFGIALSRVEAWLRHVAHWSGRDALLLVIAIALAAVILVEFLCWRFPRYEVDTEGETSDNLGS